MVGIHVIGLQGDHRFEIPACARIIPRVLTRQARLEQCSCARVPCAPRSAEQRLEDAYQHLMAFALLFIKHDLIL